MNERVLLVRKALGLSQKDFAEKLNLSRNFITLVETGNKNISNRTAKDICETFKVNETWMLTGEGDMFAPVTKAQELAEMSAAIFHADGEKLKFIKALNSQIEKMDSEQLAMLRDMVVGLAEEIKNE